MNMLDNIYIAKKNKYSFMLLSISKKNKNSKKERRQKGVDKMVSILSLAAQLKK